MRPQGQSSADSDREGRVVALNRWTVTLIGALGAVVAGFGGQSAPAAAGMAWAALAGIGLSVMLHGFGLRIVGPIIALMGVGGIVLGSGSIAWLAAPFALVLVAGVLMTVVGPRWVARKAPKKVSDDWWQRMDAGEDPTD